MFPVLELLLFRMTILQPTMDCIFNQFSLLRLLTCTFQDSYGSSLGIVNSHVILRGSNSFLNNCRLCSNKRCNNHYQGPTCYGGGAYANGSNLTITGSNTFLGNSASLGGGVSAQYGSNVTTSGNTTFSGNSAFNGGGISTQYSSNVDFTGSTTFSCNSAHDYGGGVFALHSSNVTITGNITFSNNSAISGGGVSVRESSNVDIDGSTTFTNNSASGIFASRSSNVNISGNTTFSNNSAKWGGGVVQCTVAMWKSVGTPLLEVIQLVLVEESMRHKIVMCTSGKHYFQR